MDDRDDDGQSVCFLPWSAERAFLFSRMFSDCVILKDQWIIHGYEILRYPLGLALPLQPRVDNQNLTLKMAHFQYRRSKAGEVILNASFSDHLSLARHARSLDNALTCLLQSNSFLGKGQIPVLNSRNSVGVWCENCLHSPPSQLLGWMERLFLFLLIISASFLCTLFAVALARRRHRIGLGHPLFSSIAESRSHSPTTAIDLINRI